MLGEEGNCLAWLLTKLGMKGYPQLSTVAFEVESCLPADSLKAQEFPNEALHFVMAARYGRHPERASELGSELLESELA